MKEYWDLLNVGGRFRCHRSACRVATQVAKKRGQAIMVRHHGPRISPNRDATRVNHYVWPNGQRNYQRTESGDYVDVT